MSSNRRNNSGFSDAAKVAGAATLIGAIAGGIYYLFNNKDETPGHHDSQRQQQTSRSLVAGPSNSSQRQLRPRSPGYEEYDDKKNKCSICLDGMDVPSDCAHLPCLHKFHTHCILAVFASDNVIKVCPECRNCVGEEDFKALKKLAPEMN